MINQAEMKLGMFWTLEAVRCFEPDPDNAGVGMYIEGIIVLFNMHYTTSPVWRGFLYFQKIND